MSVIGGDWKCETCRKTSHLCPLRQGDIEEGRRRLAEVKGGAPDVFRAEMAGVCPKLFLNRWSIEVMRAKNWFEAGQLGVTYLTAPVWVPEAFSIIGAAQGDAYKYRADLKRG